MQVAQKRSNLVGANQALIASVVGFFLYALWSSLSHAASIDHAQRALAQQLANNTPWGSPSERAIAQNEKADTALVKDSQSTFHPLSVQTLSVEKREQKKKSGSNSQQLAIYQFNYQTKQARLLVIDSQGQSVVSRHPIASAHLPLNETEIAHAIGLLASQASLVSKFRDEQLQSGRQPFSHIDQLDVKASVYQSRDPSHPCSSQRCALLSLFDASNTVFSTEPVVNLQTSNVSLLPQR